MDVSTATSTLQDILEAGSVGLGRISFEPGFYFPLSNARLEDSAIRFTPSVTCEYLDTTSSDHDCGGGVELEWSASSSDGLREFSVEYSREVLGGVSRDRIGLQIEASF